MSGFTPTCFPRDNTLYLGCGQEWGAKGAPLSRGQDGRSRRSVRTKEPGEGPGDSVPRGPETVRAPLTGSRRVSPTRKRRAGANGSTGAGASSARPGARPRTPGPDEARQERAPCSAARGRATLPEGSAGKSALGIGVPDSGSRVNTPRLPPEDASEPGSLPKASGGATVGVNPEYENLGRHAQGRSHADPRRVPSARMTKQSPATEGAVRWGEQRLPGTG